MASETWEARVVELEARIKEMEERLAVRDNAAPSIKGGWRAIVGIDADNPHFEEAVRLGREWRFADSSKNAENRTV